MEGVKWKVVSLLMSTDLEMRGGIDPSTAILGYIVLDQLAKQEEE